MKQAVIAPSMLALLYPLDEEVPGYSRESSRPTSSTSARRTSGRRSPPGAARVSIDFTEGRLATRDDPRNPWTGRDMLPHFIELNNRVMDRFSAEERTRIGIHTCPGGDRDSVHSADVPYSDLLPSMFRINAGYFLIQLASERDKDPVYEMIGEHLRDDANGVAQMAYIGVINPLNPRVESPEEVRDALVRAANFIPKEQLGSTDDCGFSPFSIDEKPKPRVTRLRTRDRVPEDHQPGAGHEAGRGEARHWLIVAWRCPGLTQAKVRGACAGASSVAVLSRAAARRVPWHGPRPPCRPRARP